MGSTPSRTVGIDMAYGPFGEMYANSGGGTAAFTGMTSDTVSPSSNVYDFPAREYGPQGRWPSPDPAGMAEADPANPQSWNRYAYVGNNPLAYIDPSGMNQCAPNNSTAPNTNAGSCFHGTGGLTLMQGDYPVDAGTGISIGPLNYAYFSTATFVPNPGSYTLIFDPNTATETFTEDFSGGTYVLNVGVVPFNMPGGPLTTPSYGGATWIGPSRGKAVTFKPPYADKSRPDCAAVWVEGFAEGVEASSFMKNGAAPPGQGPEDAAASTAKAGATWVAARGMTWTSNALSLLGEAFDAYGLVQFAVGETYGAFHMGIDKFVHHGCVSPLDF